MLKRQANNDMPHQWRITHQILMPNLRRLI